MDFNKEIEQEANEIVDMLKKKNESYGNSALDPVRVFSSTSTKEQIMVRLDDKLSRIQRAGGFMNMLEKQNENENYSEDIINDIIGYLLILKLALKNE